MQSTLYWNCYRNSKQKCAVHYCTTPLVATWSFNKICCTLLQHPLLCNCYRKIEQKSAVHLCQIRYIWDYYKCYSSLRLYWNFNATANKNLLYTSIAQSLVLQLQTEHHTKSAVYHCKIHYIGTVNKKLMYSIGQPLVLQPEHTTILNRTLLQYTLYCNWYRNSKQNL